MQIEAPLPSEWVVPSAPFTITGIDFAGPVNIRCLKPRDTAYIALFTCATTRALHIELVSDLTTDKFLLALQQFVGRRGLPNTIYTDNATTFHAANKELILLWRTLSSAKTQQYYAQNGITWRFIAPRVAWWERLIGIVKQCLRKKYESAICDLLTGTAELQTRFFLFWVVFSFFEVEFSSNTDHMVAKRSSQAIWMPRRKPGIRLPAFATKLGYLATKGHHEFSSRI
ncbi:integrase catalytic domain-containing protein [Nephila pilipes]|uniref:Integrase catalytic domain-containing protein n=1 Tax=Nephila pilipes TaxID=299642 RepID=A0A8X6MNA5_NEPPI|nr:integrase catalytic domain-containing protein [Nephila pilipes]